jgi:hypothetical protein
MEHTYRWIYDQTVARDARQQLGVKNYLSECYLNLTGLGTEGLFQRAVASDRQGLGRGAHWSGKRTRFTGSRIKFHKIQFLRDRRKLPRFGSQKMVFLGENTISTNN